MIDDTNSSAVNMEIAAEGPLVDQTLECRDCGDLFLFTAVEQAHYREKGLKHAPSRCPSCRKKNREAVQATMVQVDCRRCGRRGFIPHVPDGSIDALCESCLLAIKQKVGVSPEPADWSQLQALNPPAETNRVSSQ